MIAPGIRFLLAAALVMAGSPGLALAQSADATADRLAANLEPRVRVEGREYGTRSLQDWMDEYDVPAVSVAVIDKGEIVWSRAWGLADAGAAIPATPDTLFRAGSLSKPVAAMVALDLVEDGVLALDAPIDPGLRRWRIPENEFTRERPVTLRNLLDHTSGLPADTAAVGQYAPEGPVPTLEQVLSGSPPATTPPVRITATPGSASEYTSAGYAIAQLLMEDVTGQPFAELARRRVFDPLGMRSSTYAAPANAAAGRFAAGHDGAGQPLAGGFRTSPELAGVGLFTTPTDLARVLVALQESLAGRSETPLQQASAGEMSRPEVGIYTAGLAAAGEGDALALSLGGQHSGFHSLMIGFPARGQGAVLMVNGARGDEVGAVLAAAIAEAYGWPSYRPTVIHRGPVDREKLQEAVGDYRLGARTGQVLPGADGVSLEARIGPENVFELIPQGGDLYLEAAMGLRVEFLRDAEGKVTGVQFGGRRLERIQP